MKPRMTLARTAAVSASLLAALVVPATALAEPGGPDGANLQLHFFDCAGPAGTPTSFDAEFQIRGAAWHLTDSNQIFEGMIGFNETTNTPVLVTHGFHVNSVPTVTCRTVVDGNVFSITGILTPAGR